MTASAARMGSARPESAKATELPRQFLERSDIVSWGRVDRRRQYWTRPRFRDELGGLLRDARWAEKLAIGLRRSYGELLPEQGGRSHRRHRA